MAFAPVGTIALAFGGHGHHGFGYLHFGTASVAGQLFNSSAIAVAGVEIHDGMDAGGIALEDGLDCAERFNEFLPVDGGQSAHTGDGVAGGDVVGGLFLIFALLDALDGLAAVGEFLFEPVEGKAEGGIDAIDVGYEFGDEGGGEGGGIAHEVAKDSDKLAGVGLDNLEKMVGPDDGGVTLAAPPGNALGDEVEILDEREP